jgi:hypothetical protein
MIAAIIGTGGIGSVIARQLASGGETLRLSSVDHELARTLAAQIGRAAVAASDNSDALQGADAVVLALRFTALKGQPASSWSFRATRSAPTRKETSHVSCRKANPPARLKPDGCRRSDWPLAFGTLPADLCESSSNLFGVITVEKKPTPTLIGLPPCWWLWRLASPSPPGDRSPARTPSRRSGVGEVQQELEHAVILGRHETAEAGVRDVPAGEQHRDRPRDLDR